MKKWEQEILAYVLPVLFSIGYMTFFGPEISWSENALRSLNSLLNSALAGIMAVFLIEAYNHPLKGLQIYKWVGVEIRFKSFCKMIAFGFYAISIFSLNSFLPEWMHMVATGYSVIVLVILIAGWYKTWSVDWWLFTSIIVLSGLTLVMAFAFRTVDVKYPEFMLAVTGLIFLYRIRK